MLSNLYASNAYVTPVRSVSPLSHECWSCNTPRARPQFPGAGDFQGGLYEMDRFSWTPLSFVCSSDGSVAPLLCRLKVGGNRPVTTGGQVRLSVADCQLPSATFFFLRRIFWFCNNTIFQRLSSSWSSSWKVLDVGWDFFGSQDPKDSRGTSHICTFSFGLVIFFTMARIALD